MADLRRKRRKLAIIMSAGRGGGGGASVDLATAYYVNPTDQTHATIFVPGTLLAPLTVTPTSSTAGALTPVVIPAGTDQSASFSYTNTNNQTITFTNDGGLTDFGTMECPQVFIDPRGVEGTGADGTGNSALSPKLEIVSSPVTNTTYSFAEIEDEDSPIVHTLPGTAANSWLAINAASVRFTAHHRTAAATRTRKGYISGARDIAGTFGSTTINSVPVYSYAFGSAQSLRSNFVIDQNATQTTRCAPNAADSAVTYLHYGGVMEYEVGAEGWLAVASGSMSSTLNTTSAVSYDTTTRTIRFKAPNFWAALNAIQSVVGLPILYNGASNIINEATITSYDSTNGLVECSYPSGGNPFTTLFFWGLAGHPGAIVEDGQYGWSANRQTLYLRWDANDLTALASSRRPYTLRNLLLLALNPNTTSFWLNRYGTTVLADAAADYTVVSRIGGIVCEANSFALGDIIVRNMQSTVAQVGAGVQLGSSAAVSGTCGVVTEENYIASYTLRIGSTSGTSVSMTGPRGGSAKTRFGNGGTAGITVTGAIEPPAVSQHLNSHTSYETQENSAFVQAVLAGSLNPIAYQFNSGTGSTTARGRSYDRIMACALAPIDGGATSTLYTARLDNGCVGIVIDRALWLGAPTFLGATANNFKNMSWKRGIIQEVTTSTGTADHFDGSVFEDMVFLDAGNIAFLEARGATCTNCLEDTNGWQGSLTEEMWKRLTTDAARTGYEAVAMFPPAMGLADIPAYNVGLTRTINSLGIVCRDLDAGMPMGMHVFTVANPNPMTTLSLPAGVEDNDLFAATLWDNYAGRLAARLPSQASYTIAIDVYDQVGLGTTRQTFTLPVMT